MRRRWSVQLALVMLFAQLGLRAGVAEAQRQRGRSARAKSGRYATWRVKHRVRPPGRLSAARTGKTITQWDPKYRPRAKKRAEKRARPVHKNRGEHSTLRGIRVGKKYTLVNPSTGRKDANATVVKIGRDSFGMVPYAYVKFSNGYKELYAAERLHLVGKSFAHQRRYMREMARSIDDAINQELGKSDPEVRAVTMRGRNYMPRKRPRKNPVHLGPFLDHLGEPMKPREGLLGFYYGGKHTYVSRMYASFDYGTRVHEKLHALSSPFSDQASDKKLVKMMEGFTDYFTYRVITPHYGIQPNKQHSYYPYVEFADQVVSKIGYEKAHAIFFGRGKGLVTRMAKEVDKAVGKRGAFYKAARSLERGQKHPKL